MIHPLLEEYVRSETRRQFFRKGANALGMAALASLGGGHVFGATAVMQPMMRSVLAELGTLPHFAPKQNV